MSRATIGLFVVLGTACLSAHAPEVWRWATLESALAVRTAIEVRFVDETGRPWTPELWRLRMRGPSAVATEAMPPAQLPWTEGDSWRRWGVGLWTPAAEIEGGAAREIDGRLDVAASGTVVVSAVLGHAVLASRLVPPDQSIVVFALTRSQVEARFAYLRGRVVDQAATVPFVADVGLANMTECPLLTATDADGSFLRGPVLAGPATLCVEGEGRERIWRNLALQPGVNDLGAVPITPATRITGRVAHGGSSQPATAVFAFVPEHRGQPQHLARRSVLVEGDGRFAIADAGRRRVVLVARAANDALGYAVVDASRGDVADVEIALRPARRVTITTGNPTGRGLTVTFLADGTVPVAVARLAAHVRQASVAVPAGSYRLRVDGDGATLGQRDLVVGEVALSVDLGL